ncbi:hypothetical protein [Streptomyces marincola]|uniref:hypothetical protein n=1 Tax=Streptomyces marincola TaxID=2878388 RepID=UPI001CF13B66|nr:hypothetical protein [Streptomyces marincola]UCM88105.1 hypothetical protein LC193_09135 [Streptomyces marincola]
MTHRRTFVVGVLVAALAAASAGCSGDGDAPSGSGSPSPSPAPPPSAGGYAYVKVEFGQSWTDTRSQLIVMDGGEEIGRSDPLFLAGRPLFTSDGRHAFVLPSLLDEIVVISADTGETRSVPCEGCEARQTECHCQVVAPIGGSRIAWLDGENRLVVTDLADAAPTPRPTDVTLPEQDGFLDERVVPNLIAGTEGAALAAYPHGSLPGDDLMPAFLVTPDDEPRRLDPRRPDAIEEAAFSPDGTRVALTGSQEYACTTVTVVDVASGRGETAPVLAAPGTECEGVDAYIDSMWWDPDGSLHVSYEIDEGDTWSQESTAPEQYQRRLHEGRWVDADVGRATEQRQLSAGTATIRGDGTLLVGSGGRQTEIDTDVRYLIAAP